MGFATANYIHDRCILDILDSDRGNPYNERERIQNGRNIELRKQIRILISLLLCTILLWTGLPGGAEASAMESAGETFSTFAQLKSYAAKTYEVPTWLTYQGSGPLIIVENLELPDHLYLDVRQAQITVPSNVRFSATAEDHSGHVLAKSLHVAGTMSCDNLYVADKLRVDGTLTNYNRISITDDTSVTGANKITHAQKWSSISCLYTVDGFSELKKAVSAAEDAQDAHWKYLLTIGGQEMTISESLSVPENCELYLQSQVTVAKNCILDLDCRSWLPSRMTVDGTLINRGELNILQSEGGCLALNKSGTYLSEGTIACHSDSDVDLAEMLPGFKLSDFETKTCSTPLFCRILEDPCDHSIESFQRVVTAPTCVDQGYTTCRCDKCGDFYTCDPKAPTGKHTYTDDDDRDCDVCGFEREAASQNAALFRLYNPYTLEHLFTSDAAERDLLASVGWIFEGIAWYVPDSGAPVYRLYNPYDDSHFYTLSTEEIDTLLPLGWQLDGVMCCSTTAEQGEPGLRLFNPYEKKNYHHYTISEDECNMLVPLGWVLEGTAWYGIPE